MMPFASSFPSRVLSFLTAGACIAVAACGQAPSSGSEDNAVLTSQSALGGLGFPDDFPGGGGQSWACMNERGTVSGPTTNASPYLARNQATMQRAYDDGLRPGAFWAVTASIDALRDAMNRSPDKLVHASIVAQAGTYTAVLGPGSSSQVADAFIDTFTEVTTWPTTTKQPLLRVILTSNRAAYPLYAPLEGDAASSFPPATTVFGYSCCVAEGRNIAHGTQFFAIRQGEGYCSREIYSCNNGIESRVSSGPC
jgi:hypothetical protein